MMFQLHFGMDNDAFGMTDASRSEEVARILRRTAERIANNETFGTTPIGMGDWHGVHDANGNVVGEWTIFEEER